MHGLPACSGDASPESAPEWLCVWPRTAWQGFGVHDHEGEPVSITRHGQCGGIWWQSGNRTGHCGSCHRVFDGLSAFDRHRREGKCLDPATLMHDGELIFTSRQGTHGQDADTTYWRIDSEPFDAEAVFG